MQVMPSPRAHAGAREENQTQQCCSGGGISARKGCCRSGPGRKEVESGGKEGELGEKAHCSFILMV